MPPSIWDYGLDWFFETGTIVSTSSKYSYGRTALELVTGETLDIIEYLYFSFYDWVTYHANLVLGETFLGRWLGVLHNIDQLIPYWIIEVSVKVIPCTNVQRLMNIEIQNNEWKARMTEYDTHLAQILNVKGGDMTEKITDVNE